MIAHAFCRFKNVIQRFFKILGMQIYNLFLFKRLFYSYLQKSTTFFKKVVLINLLKF